MAHKFGYCLYSNEHTIQVHNQRRIVEDRVLNLIIMDCTDSVLIKLRDRNDFLFNFTEDIKINDFERMKSIQNLEINFIEFKVDLLEMLEQNKRGEMFLRCLMCDKKCSLIFYGKSKIKDIVYLTVDLSSTEEKEIFNEMNTDLHELTEDNEKLRKDLERMRSKVADKETQIEVLIKAKQQLKFQFFNHLRQLDTMFNTNIKDTQNLLTQKFTVYNKQLLILVNRVNAYKANANLKANSSARLIDSMETLRLETIENAQTINNLKKENGALHALKHSQEKTVLDLTKSNQEKTKHIMDLEKKNQELHRDLEKSTLILAQKAETHDELVKDLLQANQMLVNFNNHYDVKVREVETLQKSLAENEHALIAEIGKNENLRQEFENYQNRYNQNQLDVCKNDLILANNKIRELEEALRRSTKMTTLLSDQLHGTSNPFHK